MERGYVPNDPTKSYSVVKRREQIKNRDVIPDEVLTIIHSWL